MGLLLISSMMVLGGAYLILAFVWWLLQIIANWRIFTKAGEPGWKSIIPVYGDYISYKIAWVQGQADPYSNNIMITFVVLVLRIIIAVISIMYSVKLAKAFGRGIPFALGLIFLQPIFMLILGFGDDPYYGADR